MVLLKGKTMQKIILKKHHDVYRVAETHNILIEQKSFTKKEVEDLVAKANAPEGLGSKLTVVIKR
jgi:hypothetical protein|tara:strand:+ start:1334 stop:1528 length:195 start_codon:yes stop_codon:yes gene_type:complete